VDFDRLLDILRALEAEGAEYVLVGGVAMGLHGLVRATQDIDLFVRPSAANVAKVKAALRAVWDDPAIDEISADDLAGDYPTIRYGPPGETLVVDLIGRLGDAIRYEDLEAERKLVEGVAVSVATPATLYRMKRDTVRPIDQQDAAALRDTFGLEG
jgi:Nucleotidyl transferase AbiEii toxin, Type IV TA system